MKKTLMKAMTNSISEVMETMFFLPVEIGHETIFEESGIGADDCFACHLSFTGDAAGKLILACPAKLTAEMAQNFLGESEDRLSREHLSGTLTEMLNMVCGNALSKTHPMAPYSLGLPEPVPCSDIDGKEKFILIRTIDSRMAVSLVLEEG